MRKTKNNIERQKEKKKERDREQLQAASGQTNMERKNAGGAERGKMKSANHHVKSRLFVKKNRIVESANKIAIKNKKINISTLLCCSLTFPPSYSP